MDIDSNLIEEFARELARCDNRKQAKFFNCFGNQLFHACGNNRGHEGVEGQLAWITGEMNEKSLRTMKQFGEMSKAALEEDGKDQ